MGWHFQWEIVYMWLRQVDICVGHHGGFLEDKKDEGTYRGGQLYRYTEKEEYEQWNISKCQRWFYSQDVGWEGP